MAFDSWIAFCSIAFIATITPGPAILLVSTHSLQFGSARSLFTIAGNVSGLLLMSACSVLGLSALVLYSARAFTLIKVMGALYLFYLGIKLWRGGVDPAIDPAAEPLRTRGVNLYTQGLTVALTNPKAIIFTTALFPQFIDISQPLLPQFLLLIITFMTLSALCLFLYGYMAQRARARTSNLFSGRQTGKVFGAVFICAGAALLSVSRR